jgi:hypothetical protein
MRIRTILFIVTLLLSIGHLSAQTDTTNVKSDTTKVQNDLLNSIMTPQQEHVQLLPKKYPFTQKMLWGQKGLMRNFNAFKLSPEEREKELKIRRTMLKWHQALGFISLAGMAAQGVVGYKLYNGDYSIKGLHEGLAAGVDIAYFSTAALALFAPPKMLDERKGYSSIKVHKILAIVHLTSMIATNVLATQLESHPNLKPYHRAAALTAFGSLAAAMIVIKF